MVMAVERLLGTGQPGRAASLLLPSSPLPSFFHFFVCEGLVQMALADRVAGGKPSFATDVLAIFQR